MLGVGGVLAVCCVGAAALAGGAAVTGGAAATTAAMSSYAGGLGGLLISGLATVLPLFVIGIVHRRMAQDG